MLICVLLFAVRFHPYTTKLIVILVPFYQPLKSQWLGAKCVFKRKYLQIVDLKLILSSLNLPLSSSSATSPELLSQFSTCSGWRWLDLGEKVMKIAMYW